MLECYIKKDNRQWKITLKIPLRERTVVAEEKDFKLMQALKSAYTTLKREVKKAKELERKDYLYKRKNRVRKKLYELVNELFLVQADEKEFKKKLQNSLQEVNEYIFRRLEQELQGTIKEKDKHKLSREFYEQVYRNFSEEQPTPKKFNTWIYKQAEEFVNSKLSDKNLSVEQRTPEVEEFFEYELDRFVGADDQNDEVINKEQEELTEIMQKKINDLSTKERAILELSMNESLDNEEISTVLNISEQEVQETLERISSNISKNI